MGTNLKFAPGETAVSTAQFSPQLVLFWLRTEMAVTNRRVVLRQPNTLLIFPLGYSDQAFPLNNIASVNASVSFSLLRAIFGLILFIVGISLLSHVAILGVILFILGLVNLLNAMSAKLEIVNNAGGKNPIRVSVLQKGRLEHFRDEINERVFADNEGLRHNEVMGAHNMNQILQNQQLQAMNMQLMQGQQGHPAYQAQQPQPAQPAGPPQYQVGDVVNGHRFNGVSWEPVPSN